MKNIIEENIILLLQAWHKVKMTYRCHNKKSGVIFQKVEIQKAAKKEYINNETLITRQKENRGGDDLGSTQSLELGPLRTFNQ